VVPPTPDEAPAAPEDAPPEATAPAVPPVFGPVVGSSVPLQAMIAATLTARVSEDVILNMKPPRNHLGRANYTNVAKPLDPAKIVTRAQQQILPPDTHRKAHQRACPKPEAATLFDWRFEPQTHPLAER
jgi:hypothetical protein